MREPTDRDYIAELQARVGCPHEYSPDILLCKPPKRSCTLCKETFGVDDLQVPAPDCSTLYGAMRAATELTNGSARLYMIRCVATKDGMTVYDNDMGTRAYDKLATERDAAAAVCRLAIEELERREKETL